MKNYLDSSENVHRDLTERSKDDPKAEESANSVQADRNALLEQIAAINKADDVANLAEQVGEMQALLRAYTNQMQDSIQSAVDSAMQNYSGGYNSAYGEATPAQDQGQTAAQSGTSSDSDINQAGLSSTQAQLSKSNADELLWLRNRASGDVISLTENLLHGPLEEPITILTVNKLINAWQQAVEALIQEITPPFLVTSSSEQNSAEDSLAKRADASSLQVGVAERTSLLISFLFFVHKQLQEKLYYNLNVTVIQQELVNL
jgi:hypothetical protein